MGTVILLRHGRTDANADGILAGRLPGVQLDETGRAQAAAAAERLAPVGLACVVSSPLERCRQTARAVLARRSADGHDGGEGAGLTVRTEDGLLECDYGEWQGLRLADLAKEKLFRTVQNHPSAAAFPGGESMSQMSTRATSTVRGLDQQVTAEHGRDAVWLAVSHGDIIKAVLADALGMHLDLFQRLHVDPASVSVIRYTRSRPYVLATNSHAGDLSWLNPAPESATEASTEASTPSEDAQIGGGAGPGLPPTRP